jgi:hypothetical protein
MLASVMKLNHIDQVSKSILPLLVSKVFAYCYNLVNVIIYGLVQSDHMKQCLKYLNVN